MNDYSEGRRMCDEPMDFFADALEITRVMAKGRWFMCSRVCSGLEKEEMNHLL